MPKQFQVERFSKRHKKWLVKTKGKTLSEALVYLSRDAALDRNGGDWRIHHPGGKITNKVNSAAYQEQAVPIWSPEGIRELGCEIISLTLSDWEAIGDQPKKTLGQRQLFRDELQDFLFREPGPLDRLIGDFGIQLDPDVIRKGARLKNPERRD